MQIFQTRGSQHTLSVLASVLLLVGCTTFNSLGCPTGLTRAHTAELLFGRNIGSGEGVTDSDWQSFVDQEVTPRFPAGFSVSDVQGQWRGASGEIVRERSKELMIVLSADSADRAKLEEIRTAYKQRFHQEAVLLLIWDACIGF